MVNVLQGRMANTPARAAVWAIVATISGRVVSLGGLIFLARLLAPEDFGLVACALAYVVYVEAVVIFQQPFEFLREFIRVRIYIGVS